VKSSVLEALYDQFYQGHSSFSGVTSSHWRSVGSHEVRKVAGNEFSLLGRAFGDFKERSALNILSHTRVRAELQKLARIYACDDNLLRISQEVSKAHGRLFSFDCLKQVLSLNTILVGLRQGRYGGGGGRRDGGD
jgi:hypothetical protein